MTADLDSLDRDTLEMVLIAARAFAEELKHRIAALDAQARHQVLQLIHGGAR